MDKPLVSILLPSLNAREFLQERIDSVLAQTVSNWQAIVLDSYSTDGTWEFFQSIAATDPRFELHQIPVEGFYAALNRGIQLATGNFLYIATCDDTMAPEYLESMLAAFNACPEAGIAVSDVFLMNRDGHPLRVEDMAASLPAETIHDMLSLSAVRSGWPVDHHPAQTNYRPSPHDCLLHYSAHSAYFSLTQLLIRTTLARETPPFETTVGSIADVGWVLRLTSRAGSIHVPKKMATWRFHGAQLSVQSDGSHLHSLKMMLESALPGIYQRHRSLLSRNDCASLMLPAKSYLALTKQQVRQLRCETYFRVLRMLCERPLSTVRALRETGFRITDVRRALIPMMFCRLKLAPRPIA